MKVRISAACASKIATWSPQTEAFVENVIRAQLQACLWKHVLVHEPLDAEPTEYGWVKQAENQPVIIDIFTGFIVMHLRIPITTTLLLRKLTRSFFPKKSLFSIVSFRNATRALH